MFILPPHSGLWVFHSCARVEHFTAPLLELFKNLLSMDHNLLLAAVLPSSIGYIIFHSSNGCHCVAVD